MRVSIEWAMPNKYTFQMRPVSEFLDRHLKGCKLIVDPFSGTSTRATHSNDLGNGGIDAGVFCEGLLAGGLSNFFDAVIFDPPYSPRQISECYKSVGRVVAAQDTQNSALYKRVRSPLARLLKPGGVALSFGWQSSGFGKQFETKEIMLVQHGGAHNDTICVAQLAPNSLFGYP